LLLALQCPHCPKAFINCTFLDAHVAKRHSDVNIEPAAAAAQPLRATPTAVSGSQPAELETIKARLQQTEQRLAKEIDARNEVETQVTATAFATFVQ